MTWVQTYLLGAGLIGAAVYFSDRLSDRTLYMMTLAGVSCFVIGSIQWALS